MPIDLLKDMLGKQGALWARFPSSKESLEPTARIWVLGNAKCVKEDGGDGVGENTGVNRANILADGIHKVQRGEANLSRGLDPDVFDQSLGHSRGYSDVLPSQNGKGGDEGLGIESQLTQLVQKGASCRILVPVSKCTILTLLSGHESGHVCEEC